MASRYSQIKILLVDDTSFLRASLIKELHSIGFDKVNIDECGDGKEAFDKLRSGIERFDIVLSDWNMPRLSGLDLLKLVRSYDDEKLSKIPFVLVTTVSEKDKIIEALSFNVTSYLIKPVQNKKLLEIVEKIFGKNEG